jgi:hypothetical protein
MGDDTKNNKEVESGNVANLANNAETINVNEKEKNGTCNALLGLCCFWCARRLGLPTKKIDERTEDNVEKLHDKCTIM